MSGVNLLYIYLLIRLRFILQKFNYFIGDQQKNKKRKIDTQSPTNERKSNRINKQAEANNKGKGKETVNYIIKDGNEDQLVEVILSDSEGPFHLLADKSIATTSKVKKIKNHISGVNLLYIFINKITLRFTKIQLFYRRPTKKQKTKN